MLARYALVMNRRRPKKYATNEFCAWIRANFAPGSVLSNGLDSRHFRFATHVEQFWHQTLSLTTATNAKMGRPSLSVCHATFSRRQPDVDLSGKPFSNINEALHWGKKIRNRRNNYIDPLCAPKYFRTESICIYSNGQTNNAAAKSQELLLTSADAP